MQLDHVVVATEDLGAGAHELDTRYELASVEGGRHPAWGTANLIVPLGDTYLELITVVDPAKAVDNAFGRWVARGARGLLNPIGWAVRTADIESVAARRSLVVENGSRLTSGGERLRWRIAGVDRAAGERCLPFFVAWEEGSTFPGAIGPGSSGSLSRLVLRGDTELVAAWLGGHQLPIEVRAGPAGVAAIVLRTPGGEVVVMSSGLG
jgi:Glyoxalase-like domain